MGKAPDGMRKNVKRVVSCSSSSTNFPDDFLISILSKLQDKTLCKLKCVSKSWRSLIEDQVILEKNTLSTAPFEWDMFTDDDNGKAILHVYSIDQNGIAAHVKTYNIQDEIDNCRWWNLKFCNGFVLYHKLNKLTIYNLATKEAIRLPITQGGYDFGFDPSSGKCKLFCSPSSVLKRPFCVRTLGVEDSWGFIGILGKKWGDSIAINGSLFWLDENNSKFKSFSLTKEKFKKINLPKRIDRRRFKYSKFELGGCLCLVEQPRYQAGTKFQLEIANVWVLTDIKKNTWVRLMKNVALPVEGTTLYEYFSGPESEHALANCYFFSRGEEIVVVMRDHREQYIFWYSFLNNQFRRMKINGLPFFPAFINNHVENCISLSEFAGYF